MCNIDVLYVYVCVCVSEHLCTMNEFAAAFDQSISGLAAESTKTA